MRKTRKKIGFDGTRVRLCWILHGCGKYHNWRGFKGVERVYGEYTSYSSVLIVIAIENKSDRITIIKNTAETRGVLRCTYGMMPNLPGERP